MCLSRVPLSDRFRQDDERIASRRRPQPSPLGAGITYQCIGKMMQIFPVEGFSKPRMDQPSHHPTSNRDLSQSGKESRPDITATRSLSHKPNSKRENRADARRNGRLNQRIMRPYLQYQTAAQHGRRLGRATPSTHDTITQYRNDIQHTPFEMGNEFFFFEPGRIFRSFFFSFSRKPTH